MNNKDVLDIHAVLCDMSNGKTSRYDALYEIVDIIKLMDSNKLTEM